MLYHGAISQALYLRHCPAPRNCDKFVPDNDSEHPLISRLILIIIIMMMMMMMMMVMIIIIIIMIIM